MKEISLCSDRDFEEVLSLYNKMIYRLAYARTGNIQDAEDITQEVFLRYINSDTVFQSEEHRKAWLLRVTVNCSKDMVASYWNRNRSDISAEEPTEERKKSPQETWEEKNYVLEAVRSLPEKYRVVVHLFYYEELSAEQIANVTDCSLPTVKTRLHRARKMLEKILKEDIYE